MGRLCADGHDMAYWGGIGATCRRCGRIEIDGEFYGYGGTDGVIDMTTTCATCHHEANHHRASPDGPECPCTVHDCGCVDFTFSGMCALPDTVMQQQCQFCEQQVNANWTYCPYCGSQEREDPNRPPVLNTGDPAAPQYPAAHLHDQQRMNETSATGYQPQPGTFGDRYYPGNPLPAPEPALPNITDEPTEGTAGLPAKTNVHGLARILQSGATVFVGKVEGTNGGAYLEFKSEDGQRTPLRLSADAMAAVIAMWTEITWGAP